jgi:hypothetical protein
MAGDRVGFQSEPQGRGTITIVSNCLFTWFICLWTIYHINCPAKGDRAIVCLVRKAALMLYLSVFSELALQNAFTQWREAKRLSIDMKSLAESSSSGELVSSTPSKTPVAEATQAPDLSEPWTMMHSLSCIAGIFVVWLPEENRYCPLNCKQLIWALKNKCIERPDVKRKELEDRSKMDSFLKALSILQTVYFIAQCIARANQSLSTMTLEVATIGYITCMLPTLYFWWEKPYDVTCPIELPVKDWPSGACGELRKNGDYWIAKLFFVGRYRSRDRLPSRLYNNMRTESTFAQYKPSSKLAPWDVTNYCMLLLSGLLFGSMHLLAWNYSFATIYEKWLWRGSSLIIILTAGMIGVDICCAHLIRNKEPLRKLWFGIENVFYAVYFVSRMYLLVEVFLAFRDMRRGVYETVDWTLYVPSF